MTVMHETTESKVLALLRERLVTPGEDVKIFALEGGITNRNYRVAIDGTSRWVVRVFCSRGGDLGIDRAVERQAALAAASGGYGPAVVDAWDDVGMLVTEFVTEGSTLTPKIAQEPNTITAIATALKKHHNGSASGGRFLVQEVVAAYAERCHILGAEVPPEIDLAVGQLRKITAATAPRLGADGMRPCHNDLLPGNFLRLKNHSVLLLDWEYAGMGDRFFDIGNLAVNLEFSDDSCARLLASYFGEVRPADLAHLHLMRVASDLREAAWGYLQSALSDLDEDFSAYGERHLQRFLSNAADARITDWMATVTHEEIL